MTIFRDTSCRRTTYEPWQWIEDGGDYLTVCCPGCRREMRYCEKYGLARHNKAKGIRCEGSNQIAPPIRFVHKQPEEKVNNESIE